MKTRGGQTTIYVNKYYEKTTGTGTVETTNYLLGKNLWRKSRELR